MGLSLSLVLGLSCSTDTTEDPTDKTRVFATVSADATVVVLDDVSHKTLKTIPIGAGPAIVLATPDHKQLYTANWADNSVSAIDTKTYAVVNIPMANRPYVIAMAPDGQHVYAGINQVNQIAVINTSTLAIERTIAQDVLPASIIVSPDGKTLYVARLGSSIGLGNGTLIAVAADTGSVVQQPLTVGGAPGWITISPDGKKVYTLNATTDDVTVVDTASWSVEATIPTGDGSQGIIGVVTPDGKRLYVTNHGRTELIGISTATNTIDQTIPLTGKPVGVGLNADGTHVYVTDFGTDSAGGLQLSDLSYLTSGVYTGTGAGQVSEFDVATGTKIGTTAVTGPGATSVVVVPPATSDVK